MKFKHEKINDYFLLDTKVENIFINEYMSSAPGDYVKVYMIARMHAGMRTNITNEDIANQLGLDFEDVLKAWTFWEKLGVVRKLRNDPDNKLDYDIEFINLKESLYSDKVRKKPISLSSATQDTMADKDVQQMFTEIEKTIGRVISGTEMMEILSVINDFNVTPELVSYCYSYCAKKKKNNIKYITEVLKQWAENGLHDVESVEKQLSENDRKYTMYNRVFQALGFKRLATEEEMRIMDTWFEDMKFSMDTVLSACGKTAGISSPNINYVNKVLENWYEEQGGSSSGNKNEPTAAEKEQYYEAIRTKAEKEAEERCAEVYEKVPRIKEIDDEISSYSRQIPRLIISDRIDKEKAIEEMKEKVDSLYVERAFLLTSNGYEMDFTDIRYICPICKDTGILEAGERCQCFQEITKEKINLITRQN